MSSDNIKRVALFLFAEHGYTGTSLSDIAKEVGIKKPSIYAHFTGKEELFLDVFRDVMNDYVKSIEQLVVKIKTYSVNEKLYTILRDTCNYYMHNEEQTAFLKRTMMFPPSFLEEKLRSEFLASEEATSTILHAVFHEGIKNGTIKNIAVEELLAAYYCQIDGLFMQMFYYSRDNFESKFESVWNIFWEGIRHQDS